MEIIDMGLLESRKGKGLAESELPEFAASYSDAYKDFYYADGGQSAEWVRLFDEHLNCIECTALRQFNKHRSDLVCSDREAAAFALTFARHFLDYEGEIDGYSCD